MKEAHAVIDSSVDNTFTFLHHSSELRMLLNANSEVISISSAAVRITGCCNLRQGDPLQRAVDDVKLLEMVRRGVHAGRQEMCEILLTNPLGEIYPLFCWLVPDERSGYSMLYMRVTTVETLSKALSSDSLSGLAGEALQSEKAADAGASGKHTTDEQGEDRSGHRDRDCRPVGRCLLDSQLRLLYMDSIASGYLDHDNVGLVGSNLVDLLPANEINSLMASLRSETGVSSEGEVVHIRRQHEHPGRLRLEFKPVRLGKKLQAVYLQIEIEREAPVPTDLRILDNFRRYALQNQAGHLQVSRTGELLEWNGHANTLLKMLEDDISRIRELVPSSVIRRALKSRKPDRHVFNKPVFIDTRAGQQRVFFSLKALLDGRGRIETFFITFFSDELINHTAAEIGSWIDDTFLDQAGLPVCVLCRDFTSPYYNQLAADSIALLVDDMVSRAGLGKTLSGLKSAIQSVFKRNSRRTVIYRSGEGEEFDYRIVPCRFEADTCVAVAVIGRRKQQPGVKRASDGVRRDRKALSYDELRKIGTVAIICDSVLLRKHLTRILDTAGIALERQYYSLSETSDVVQQGSNPIVLYAITYLDDDALNELRTAAAAKPHVKLFAICLAGDGQAEAKIIRTGVKGVILGEQELHMLPVALHSVSRGELWCSRGVLCNLINSGALKKGADLSQGVAREKLTPREQEVLQQIGLHKTNKEIAQELGVSYTTVVSHVYNIYKKMDFKNRYEAIDYLKS